MIFSLFMFEKYTFCYVIASEGQILFSNSYISTCFYEFSKQNLVPSVVYAGGITFSGAKNGINRQYSNVGWSCSSYFMLMSRLLIAMNKRIDQTAFSNRGRVMHLGKRPLWIQNCIEGNS